MSDNTSILTRDSTLSGNTSTSTGDTSTSSELRCSICGTRNSDASFEDWLMPCECGWVHQGCINGDIRRLASFNPGKSITCRVCNVTLKIEPPVSYVASMLYSMRKRPNNINCRVCGKRRNTRPLDEWTLSCPCGYSHQGCLKGYTTLLSAYDPGKPIMCGVCHNVLKIEPPVPYCASTYQAMKKRWKRVNNVFASVFGVVAFEAFAMTSGMASLCFILDREEVRQSITTEPCYVTEICLCIYASTALICSIPWEETVMQVLRKGSHLPLIGGFLPIEDEYTLPDPIIKYPLVDALLLPFFAKAAGDLIFFYQECKMRRYITGGLAMLLLKGVCTMYYTQKVYYRFVHMDIENFESDSNTNR